MENVETFNWKIISNELRQSVMSAKWFGLDNWSILAKSHPLWARYALIWAELHAENQHLGSFLSFIGLPYQFTVLNWGDLGLRSISIQSLLYKNLKKLHTKFPYISLKKHKK